MKDIIKVAKWEIKKNIKSKMFLIMTFVLPVLILIVGAVSGYFGAMGENGESETIKVRSKRNS